MDFLRTHTLVAIGTLALAASAPLATAAAVDFAGKTVEFVIPFAESGGSARWANFFAPLLSEALPGRPTVVVRYRPGAGSTAGANWFQDQQDKGDGTLIFGDFRVDEVPLSLGRSPRPLRI